ncbi:TRAP transporter small permease [Paracoccus seriniphilus]|uniref:TRAP transporter small permease protein n=1 Tax=Paracoccus seriniphilus TaxID=184748 RepID=A0A239PZ32_9RHOB|nr:TRAP transporter small permease [Paracoccus seriniphilus]WCR15729.1 TRAP transporter small permease [Paracoccus seriniphilus]SNT75591.1 TRAP-type C4-dicarboxylate transport system, small permease component [Paracoccus seriniphilus]
MLLRKLELAKRTILILCNLAIMLIVVASFLARYLFAYDLYGAEEFLLIAAFWLYFIGAAFGSYEQSHIEADFIQSMVGDTVVTRVLGYLRDVIELGVLIVLTYWSWLLIAFSIERWPVSPGWKIPLVVPQSGILVGFILMTLHASVHFWRRITGRPTKE